MTKLGATPEMVEGMLGSWAGYLKQASFSGYLCCAPNDGQQARFTHPVTWLRKPPVQLDNNNAFDALTTRYLGTYGPATALDLGHWWGINQGQAKRRLAAIGDVAKEVSIEGEPYWMLTRDVADLAATEPVSVVRLLPAFDQWVVCASRRVPALLDPKYRQRIYRHGRRMETRTQRADGVRRDRTVRQTAAADSYTHCGRSRTLSRLPRRRSEADDPTVKPNNAIH